VQPSLGIREQRIHNAQSRLDFDRHPEPSTLNDDQLVRSEITYCIRQSSKSREQIAESMSASLGVRVTAKMLNTYSAGSMEPNRLPTAWLRAFCAAVGHDALFHAVAAAFGYRAIRGEEIELLELGREFLRQKRAAERMATIEASLRGVEEL
jgi:hypothetical protein